MFDDCHLRLGQGPFAHCTPLTVSLLASLYALPARDDASLRGVLEAQASEQPWSASLAIAADQTTAAVGAMLRTIMLATSNLDPEKIDVDAIPNEGRARSHLAALRDIWRAHPEVIPSDLAHLKDFLGAPANRALQSIAVIRDRDDARLTLLERTVLERLEAHHGTIASDDRDVIRLISGRKAAAAPATTLLGHVQRNLLDAKAAPANQDDSLCVLSVRDSLTECEAAAAMIQHWLDQDPSLAPAEIGVILPSNGDHALYLAETFDRAGLVASNLPMPAPRRNIGAEAVLHFVQCRRRPAPAMALASLYCSPVLCWSPEDGNAIAHGVMKGDFVPRHARTLASKSALLFALIRAPAPRTTRQLKLQLRAFRRLLSDDPDLREDVLEAKVQIVRLRQGMGMSGCRSTRAVRCPVRPTKFLAKQYPFGATLLRTFEIGQRRKIPSRRKGLPSDRGGPLVPQPRVTVAQVGICAGEGTCARLGHCTCQRGLAAGQHRKFSMGVLLQVSRARFWSIWQRAASHEAGNAAAVIAFFAILGLVPALSAIGLICGWLSGPHEVLKAFVALCRPLPPATGQFVLKQLVQTLASGGRDGAIALLTTLGLGLYGLMNAAQALIDGLNLAYRLPEQRGWLIRAAVTVAMALSGVVAVVVMIAVLIAISRLGSDMMALHGMIVWLSVPCAIAFAIWLLTMVYRFAPSRQHGQPHRVLPGAVTAVILGMAGSAGFALYAAHLANFTATYGLLASVAPILLWLQICGYVVLLGASVNAEFTDH